MYNRVNTDIPKQHQDASRKIFVCPVHMIRETKVMTHLC